ncbi:helix-turn-helix domain-containing protein, partial [Candidatus Woesearchaeota archaeon]|nr:helix-turn-helix domain-containing protein [Candidatus Woesearchaeota archaeon]
MNCAQYTPNGHQNATPAVARSRYRYAQTEFPVLADRSLTATDIRIYSILKLHRNAKTGHAWPSRATIASIADCTPDHVTKATRRLEKAGYLTRTLKSGQSNLYTFPLADGFEIKPQPAKPPSVNQASPVMPVVVEIPPAVVVEASPVVPVVVEIPPAVV